ncbi:flagellar hook-length control protein FliK [Stutzerimonas kirkiae]|uniref:Flagellar hook-length control protein FliK n=1 Tax=Stutzerimonas kirkiae TaxID=2211392 RepID=A0A4Q9RBG4_9GAMM|nr:flagellar hook-length control protein FliK [Stutzerimonas kirkiae]TBU98271.1 flagellar hook-length control protein FliK [Stutzerimonas kirkiae]TBV00945.1 flagellar hook-length control protein FliK [Stutzerimonas kirkiae]TBV07770.1 flagellar hook-length control protein FliK [Stutzerimonas kirkiae]
MTEINTIPTSATGQVVRTASVAPETALRLLQTQTLLAIGESAEAEIISVRQTQTQTQAQNFDMTLRLTLPSGQQATLEASAGKPLSLGTGFTVTAQADSRLQATLLPDSRQPASSIDLSRLPVGSTVQARVIASQAQPVNNGQPTYKAVISLLEPSFAGQKLVVESSSPLSSGSLLTLQVQGSQSLSLVPLNGRIEQWLLGQQLDAQLARQAPTQELLKALQNLTGGLPGNLQAASEKLLGLLPDLQQLSDPKTLAQALARSGVFLEARLMAGQPQGLPGDIKAALLRLIAQLPNTPGSTPMASAQVGAALGQALPAFARSTLGALGQAEQRQLALDFPLKGRLQINSDGEADLEVLLKLAAAAISRLQTHQLSSLAQTTTSNDGTQLTTWQLELPMRDQRDIVPLQIKLQREEKHHRDQQEKNDPLWKVDLAFDIAPLGPLQVQAQLYRGSISSQIWAEQAQTAQLVDHELGHLRERLLAGGLVVGELSCQRGTPPQGPRTAVEQRFVDERA